MMEATALMPSNLQIANRTSSPQICDMQTLALQTQGMTFGFRLKTARSRRFDTGKEAADFLGISYGTYGGHEASSRTPKSETVERYAKAFGVRAAWLSYDEGPMTERTTVPLVGFISAGGAIDTSTEQAEPGVEYEAELYVNVPDAVQAYQVVGESMLPVFEPDTVIVCRAYSNDPAAHIGKRVAIGTKEGERFIKVIQEGTLPDRFNLESLNAGFAVMRNIEIEWVARIAAIIPADEWVRLGKAGKRAEAVPGRSRR